ncbi:MAG TPA: hypothetical protein VL132_15400 [Planctomycetaceae bacterium]|nr:hypothetical protein [Planctomycetaceae bacterium]
MYSSVATPVRPGRISMLAGLLLLCAGCGGGGATVPTVTFRPEAVEEMPAPKPAGDASAAPAAANEE